jgi:hypothetical protein
MSDSEVDEVVALLVATLSVEPDWDSEQLDKLVQLARTLVKIVTDFDKPNLELAATRELLLEVSVRMQLTQNSTAGRELGSMCRQAIENLDVSVLNYRTINS